MKKLVLAATAVAFLFGASSFVSAQSATDINGIKIYGTGNITFAGVARQYTIGTNVFADLDQSSDQAEYRAELFFDKTFSNGSRAVLRLRGGANDTTPLTLGSIRGGVNDQNFGYGANDDILVVKEIYFVQPIAIPVIGKAALTVGKFGALTSGNNGAASVGSFFTDDATADGPAGAMGVQNPYGVKIDLDPIPLLTISYAYLSDERTVNSVAPTSTTVNSLTEGGYNVAVLNFKNFVPTGAGNYRIGYWYSATRNSVNEYDNALNDFDPTLPYDYSRDRRKSDSVGGWMENAQGIFISVDQVVIENVTAFVRYGKRLDRTNYGLTGKAGQDFQIGGKVGGSFWGRAADSVFVGYGIAWYQDKVINSDNKIITGIDKEGNDIYESVKPEQHIEINYSLAINEGVSIIVFGQYAYDILAYNTSATNVNGANETYKNRVDASGYAVGTRLAIKF
jgi:hypothetical protein